MHIFLPHPSLKYLQPGDTGQLTIKINHFQLPEDIFHQVARQKVLLAKPSPTFELRKNVMCIAYMFTGLMWEKQRWPEKATHKNRFLNLRFSHFVWRQTWWIALKLRVFRGIIYECLTRVFENLGMHLWAASDLTSTRLIYLVILYKGFSSPAAGLPYFRWECD